MHDPEPNADAQREQALTSCPDQLAERLLDLRRERTLDRLHRRDDLRRGYLLHGGSSCPRGLGWRLSRSQHERTRREDRRSKFYELPDNLWTDQGVRNFKDTVDRYEAAENAFKELGVTFTNVWWTLGAHDIVATVEAPDDDTLAAALLAVAAQGNLRSETLRAFSREEMRAIISKAS
jgi:uncharacterized protein with GYD domain